MSLLILLLSSAVGVAANLVRPKPLTWIRRELPKPVAPAPTTTAPETPAASAPSARPDVVSIDEVLQHLSAGSATMVDARETNEYVEGHLKGAFNMPSSAAFKAGEVLAGMVPPDAKIIVYCGGGDCEASHNVSDALKRDFGFTDVFIYEKGWEEIEKSGRFTEFVVTGEQP
ncbi:MAG TPA: rhodanese-like domain-containing protein [Phycisphaerae bacterium]|nr:rhodanese-like domain-containing protein [Phycisphaerae bacterium]